MKIEPTYVTFEQARWLKGKEFDVECNSYFELAITSRKHKYDGYSAPFGWKKGELNTQAGYFVNNIEGVDTSNKSWYLCSRPEQWQVVEWLRVKYKINVFAIRDGGYWISKYQDFNKEEEQSPKEIIIAYKNTKEEAYSAAFDYILKELI
jgi:hypothetical protein